MSDIDIQEPPPSFQAQLQALEVGECVSKVRELPNDTPVSTLYETMMDLRHKLHNVLSPAVSRAKKKTGRKFSLEVGSMITNSGTHLAVAVVKRVE